MELTVKPTNLNHYADYSTPGVVDMHSHTLSTKTPQDASMSYDSCLASSPSIPDSPTKLTTKHQVNILNQAAEKNHHKQFVEKGFFSTLGSAFSSALNWITSWFTSAPSTQTTKTEAISAASTKPISIPTIPQLEKPEPLSKEDEEQLKAEIRTKIDASNNQNSIDYSSLSFEKLMQMAMSEYIATCQKNSEMKVQITRYVHSFKKLLEENKENEYKEVQKRAKINQKCNTAQKVVSSLALALGALAAIAGGPSIIAFAALGFGAVALVDHFYDDAAKRKVASWIARGDQESEAAWLGRIQFGVSIAQLLASLGVSQLAILKIASQLSSATVSSIKMVTTAQQNNHQASLIELEHACKMADADLDTLKKQLVLAFEAANRAQLDYFRALNSQHDIMMRS